jgi:hypothetical protein
MDAGRLTSGNKGLVPKGTCQIDLCAAPYIVDGHAEGTKMTRILISAATTALLTAQLLGAAHASTISYNLALNNTFGPENGTGSFTVNGPIASTGLEVFTATTGLSSLNFLIDGATFTLGNALPGADVTFFNGKLTNIAYAGFSNGINLTLDTLGLYYLFKDADKPNIDSAGTISASATPLPSTWSMMLIGLAGFGFMLLRKKRHDAIPGVAGA